MGALKELLDSVAASAENIVLRERLRLAADLEDASEKEKLNLKTELADAREELSQLRSQLDSMAKSAAKEFEEESGALFKRSPGGGFFETVYCPACKTSVGWVDAADMFVCTRCGWHAPFDERDLRSILARLKGLD